MNPAEIIETDSSPTYLTMLRIKADSEYNGEFVQHMLDGAIKGHYKYGEVSDKPATHYERLAEREYKNYEQDRDLEHMVNIANYSMFRFMMNGKQGAGFENDQELVDIGVEAMKRFNHPEEGDKYVAKKSPLGKSVTKITFGK